MSLSTNGQMNASGSSSGIYSLKFPSHKYLDLKWYRVSCIEACEYKKWEKQTMNVKGKTHVNLLMERKMCQGQLYLLIIFNFFEKIFKQHSNKHCQSTGNPWVKQRNVRNSLVQANLTILYCFMAYKALIHHCFNWPHRYSLSQCTALCNNEKTKLL